MAVSYNKVDYPALDTIVCAIDSDDLERRGKARTLCPNMANNMGVKASRRIIWKQLGKFLKPFTAKYLPEQNIIPSTIGIWEDKVLNIIWEEEPIAILIISNKASKSYKSYFEMLWKMAKS